MTERTKELLAEALKLPPEDRARLGAELLDSLDDGPQAGIDAAWRDEIVRRIKAVESGEASSHPWSEVYERLRAKLSTK